MTDTEVAVSSIEVEVHMRSNNYGLDGRFTYRLISNGRHGIKIKHQKEILSNLTCTHLTLVKLRFCKKTTKLEIIHN
jgi:hypothetical protein